ncbi:MAG: fucose isomerase, partial [Verrucomicrobiaceae bacterium]
MSKRTPSEKPTIYLAASGDMRPAANETCWPAQALLEKALGRCLSKLGYSLKRAHPYKSAEKHGFISSQKEGLEVFRQIDPAAPLIIAEAVWQYSHHVLPGLTTHRGPILTLANWSGQWPGLVGMLNLNGSLTKAGIKYSTLWSEDFTDDFFLRHLKTWLEKGAIRHITSHTRSLDKVDVPARPARLGEELARELMEKKAIMGVFDEGCMGMYNA